MFTTNIERKKNFFGRNFCLIWQDVGRVPGTEELGQDQPCPHWQHHLSPTLHIYCHVPAGVLADSHHPSVCRKPNRLCSHKGHPRGCAQYLLLDPLNVHNTQCLLEAYRHWCGTPGHWQDNGPWWASLPQVLPVGLLLPLLSGKRVILIWLFKVAFTLRQNTPHKMVVL